MAKNTETSGDQALFFAVPLAVLGRKEPHDRLSDGQFGRLRMRSSVHGLRLSCDRVDVEYSRHVRIRSLAKVSADSNLFKHFFMSLPPPPSIRIAVVPIVFELSTHAQGRCGRSICVR